MLSNTTEIASTVIGFKFYMQNLKEMSLVSVLLVLHQVSTSRATQDFSCKGPG